MKGRFLDRLSLKLICHLYLMLLLLVASILSSLPYSPLALILLLGILFITIRPLRPERTVATIVAVIFLLPLILEPSLRYLVVGVLPLTALQVIAVIVTVPGLYLLDYALRQYAKVGAIVVGGKSRQVTPMARALIVTVLAITLVSLLIGNLVLLFTSFMLGIYLLALLIWSILAIPRLPVNIPTAFKRIIAGSTVTIPLYATSRTGVRLHCLVSPVDSWVRVNPQRFILNDTPVELGLSITPPLAGPTLPQCRVSVTDSRGLIQANQVIEPVELQVIPRAKYAEWLALKYLEQTGAKAMAAVSLDSARILKGGMEYYDSRDYQPGDQLRDMDWKHTIKLSQLIVKEYIEVGRQMAIVAVNLSVGDAEEADKLAFSLITTTLTLAREAIPTALAVYDHEKVVLTTGLAEPRETLKRTLSLVKDISLAEFPQRYLQPVDISKLRQNINQLQLATSEPAKRLATVLDLEYRALTEAAKNHPAALALLSVVEQVPSMAFVILVSQLNHDAEALLITTQRLEKRGFVTMRSQPGNLDLQRYSNIGRRGIALYPVA